ncbi:hypothetical protein RhiirA5_432850 [Rhizophagus irregularis]|uniref:Uncharacterized protein n=1 Tax=Rhizophagus irregularis TaxID=588596 RepID=A0A2N0NSN4_9GLOM|nr:hypothetical protein RhiirA5_432850 [Rhizophagus irregularis]
MPNTPHYNKFIINEAYKLLEYNKICSYPKHNEYRNQSKNLNQKSKNLNLEKVSKRLISILQLDENDKICKIADADLIGFFDELYEGTNPASKSEKTNNNNKKKLVSLYYFLASINNKYINRIKVKIGSYLQTSGASAAIDTLANLGLSVPRKTVDRKKGYYYLTTLSP